LVFLKRLEETCGSCGWRVHAWVLMGNHFHLLLETPQPTPISPPTGPATGSSNGLHPKSKFLAITSASVYQVSSVTSGRSREFATPLPWQHSPWIGTCIAENRNGIYVQRNRHHFLRSVRLETGWLVSHHKMVCGLLDSAISTHVPQTPPQFAGG
jgi:REP element-mobilizing transposase RayT